MKKQEKENSNDLILNKLVDSIYERTCAWGEKNGFLKKDTKKSDSTRYSERAKRLAKLLDEHSFGGHSAVIREAFEIAINETLPPAKKDKLMALTYELGIIVVPLSDPNSHGYTLGEPLLIIKSDGRGADANNGSGCVGKQLPNNSLTAIRPATKNEIQQLLEDMMQHNSKSFNIILASFFLESI